MSKNGQATVNSHFLNSRPNCQDKLKIVCVFVASAYLLGIPDKNCGKMCLYEFPCLLCSREMNKRLTGWVFAHLVNLICPPSKCPLSKIAHQVNYHAQGNILLLKISKLDLFLFSKID